MKIYYVPKEKIALPVYLSLHQTNLYEGKFNSLPNNPDL